MTKKRLDIQGLRAIAICGVLGFHVWPKFVPNGYLGVDMFFSLSGYLMATLLNKPEKITRKITYDFYFRRIRRIVPVYLIIIAMSLFSALLILCRFDYKRVLVDVKSALYFWSNMVVLFEKEDYFKQLSSTKFFLHTWSLSVEMQFYLFVPLIFTLLKLKSGLTYKIFLTNLIIFASLLIYFNSSQKWAFEFLPCRVWQFFSGILAFYAGQFKSNNSYELLDQKVEIKPRLLNTILTYLSIILLASLFFVKVPFSMGNLLIIFVTSTLLYLGSVDESNKLLSNFIFVWIGDLSYTVYLLHWPIIQLIRYLSTSLMFGLIDGSLVLALSITLSSLIYEFVERPLLKISNLKDLMKILCSLYLTIFLLYITIEYKREPEFYSQTPKYTWILQHLTKNETRQVAINMLTPEMKSQLSRIKTYIPCGKTNGSYHKIANLPKQRIKWECNFEGKGKLKVLFIGNSHAHSNGLAWIEALKGKFKRMYFFMTSGCLVFEKLNDSSCQKFGKTALKLVKDFKPDILIVFHRYIYLTPLEREMKNDKYFWAMQSFFNEVQPYVSQKIFIDRPMVEFPHENGPFEAAKRIEYGMEMKSMSMSKKTYFKMFKDTNIRLDNLMCDKCHFIDYRPFFCGLQNYCLPYDSETQIFYLRDNHHLNIYGNMRIAQYYRSIFDKVLKV